MEQVGGDHYKSNYQHWDWAVDVGLGPLEYGATRYICRHWKKNGIEDLKKARHFIEKLRNLERTGDYEHYKNIKRSKRSVFFIQDMNRFSKENNIPYIESRICEKLATWNNNNDLFNIKADLEYLIKSSEMAAGAATTGQATTPAQQGKDNVPAPSPAAVVGQTTGDVSRVNQPNPFGFPEN